MKDLLIKALDEAIKKLDKQTPTTKESMEYVNIESVKPDDLMEFMKNNNIPHDARFSTLDDEGAFNSGGACLVWDIDIPMTAHEILEFRKSRFSTIAFTFIYKALTENGYKRIGFSTRFLKEFDDTTVYDMYLNNEIDRLVKYYSLPFTK